MNINRIIFCDSENIQKDVLKALEVLREDDYLIIMCSPNTFKIEVQELSYFRECKGGIEIFNCSAGTQNAMDFYIVSEVVSSMSKSEAKEYYILSNDKGYSPLIKLWNNRGYKLHLISDPDLLRYNLESRRIIQGDEAVKEFKDKNESKIEYQVEAIKGLKFENRSIVLKPMDASLKNSTETQNNTDVKNEEHKNNDEETTRLEEAKALEEAKIQKMNELIKKTQADAKQKEMDKLKDVPLEDLEDDALSNKDYNIKRIRSFIGVISTSKEKDLLTVISENKEFNEDVENMIRGIFKRQQNTYVEKVRDSWDMYRHE